MNDGDILTIILQIAPVLFAAGMVVWEVRRLSETVRHFERRLQIHDERAVESRERIRALERRVFGRTQKTMDDEED